MPFLPPNQQRQSTEGWYRSLIGNLMQKVEPIGHRVAYRFAAIGDDTDMLLTL